MKVNFTPQLKSKRRSAFPCLRRAIGTAKVVLFFTETVGMVVEPARGSDGIGYCCCGWVNCNDESVWSKERGIVTIEVN
jgi:hypothetical protein